MPHFDFYSFFTQSFWVLIFFFFTYFFIYFFLLIKISEPVKFRTKLFFRFKKIVSNKLLPLYSKTINSSFISCK
jgi:hypothetical protein